jgi:DNA-binding CsgD family transcriptional regulator/tetratricopeptide (TPR) repeat protein
MSGKAEHMGGGRSWPMVGRASELADARAALDDGGVVLVWGATGVGKSRLVEALTGDSTREWRHVRAAPGLAGIPLGAFTHLLPEGTDGDDPSTAWRALHRAIRGTQGPAGLVVDDAHWLDEVSAALVHQVATDGSVAVAVTVRTGERVPPAIARLRNDLITHEVELGPLTQQQVGDLLELALDGPIDAGAAMLIATATQGNPLFLRELVEGAVAANELRRDESGRWLAASLTPPPRLRDLIEDRLSATGDRARRVLIYVSLAGSLTPTVLDLLATPDEVADAEDAGLLRSDGILVEPAHPLFADVAVAALGPQDRRARVRALVDAITSVPEALKVDVGLRVVQWQLDCGLPVPSAQLAGAAQRAVWASAFNVAERLARAAVTQDADPQSLLCLGEALLGQGRHAEADDVLVRIDHAALDHLDRARWAMLRALALGTVLGRLDEAVPIVESVVASLPDGTTRRTTIGFLAGLLAEQGSLIEAFALVEPHLLDREADPAAATWSTLPATVSLALRGRSTDALEVCDQMMPLAVARMAEAPYEVGWATSARLLALYIDGRLDEFDQLAETVATIGRSSRDRSALGGVFLLRGVAKAYRGELRTGLGLLQQALTLNQADDRRGWLAWTWAAIARTRAQLGQQAAAAEALVAAEATTWGGSQVIEVELDLGRAWVAGVAGRLHDAQTLLRATADRMRSIDAAGLEIYALHEAIRLGLPAHTEVERVEALATNIQGARGVAYGAHARGLADNDPEQLEEAGRRFDAFSSWLMAAEAYLSAAGAYEDRGLAARAAEVERAAQLRLARCERARTPLLVASGLAAKSVLHRLTPREMQIAIAAAAGRTSTEVAASLDISRRTAETHLQHVYTKLGLHNRSELAALLDPSHP